ncbi:MAG: hypothetical protein EXR68_01760 [Dehalococcoidia bacterium]|nr:hypothetical protein [Dehalococcoidia bacterium]
MSDHDVVNGDAVPEAARERLRAAMALHSADEIEGALAAAGEALALAPAFADAHGYLGNTLVTRRRRFADGLAVLERAASLAPRDAVVHYTLGWCLEFVANALARPRGAHQPVVEGPAALYARARDALLRARALGPGPGLRGDIEDLLDVIASATGEPWRAEVER